MSDQVRRETVKLGLDFRTIPVDVGDGIEWDFHPDPNPQQWADLMSALKAFGKFGDEDFGGDEFKQALATFTESMANMLAVEAQKAQWIEKAYGLGPQQAISEALMKIWTGFPTKPSSPSGAASKTTG